MDGQGHLVGVADIFSESVVELFHQFGQIGFVLVPTFTHAVVGDRIEPWGLTFWPHSAQFFVAANPVVGQLQPGQIDLFSAHPFEPLTQQAGETRERFQIGVTEVDQLGDVLVVAHELGQAGGEHQQFIPGFGIVRPLHIGLLHPWRIAVFPCLLPGRFPVVNQAVEFLQPLVVAIRRRLGDSEQLLMRYPAVHHRQPESFDLLGFVDVAGIEHLLEVIDHVGILHVRHLGIAVVGFEGCQDFLGLVHKVDDAGLVLAGEGAVQAREGLHRLHPGNLLVHVHGHQLGLVKAGLVFVGDDHHLVLGGVERLAHVAPVQAGVEVGFAESVVSGQIIGNQHIGLFVLVDHLPAEGHHRMQVGVAPALAVTHQRPVVGHRRSA